MYRNIHTELWSDPKIKEALKSKNPDTVLLFLWFITNELAHLSGIYAVEKFFIMGKLNYSDKRLDDLLHTLNESKLAFYDHEFEVVFVRSMFKHQGRGAKNEQSAAKHLETLHGCPLILKFLETYPNVKNRVSDTLLDRVSGNTRTALLCSDSVSDPVSGTVSGEPKKPKSSHAVISGIKYSENFQRFWLAYPHRKRKGKKPSFELWQKKKLDDKINIIVKALEEQSRSVDWVKESGQYIPNPTTWLNQERWEDTVTLPLALSQSTKTPAGKPRTRAIPGEKS
jgi:hypothetical protein